MFSKVKEMSQITAKRTADEAQLTAESVTEKKSKAVKGPWMPIEFDTNGNPVAIKVEKDLQGELTVRVRVKGKEDDTFAAQFNTPCMTVQYNDLKAGGNSDGKYNNETNYTYNIKAILGLPEKVSDAMPKEEARQQAFWTWADRVCKDLLEKAWETSGCMESHKKKATKLAKKNKTEAKTEFINGANLSMFKEYTDKEGEDHAMFVCKRKGLYKNADGEPIDNRPVFWKRTREGFEKMDVKYISQGSVLKYQVGFRAYATPTMYGISCNLGKNIVVVYQKNKPAPDSSSSNEPNVPYIEF